MLKAMLGDRRVDALNADRDAEHRCGGCGEVVVLKRGRKVVAHFAHKPPTNCTWAKGETRAHMNAKAIVAGALIARERPAEVEHIVSTLSGDRRADVFTQSTTGVPVAIELQHINVGLDDIERRAFSYARAGIAQMWVPFIRPTTWVKAQRLASGRLHVERYQPRPFEIWVHGFNGRYKKRRGMWMHDPRDGSFYFAVLNKHEYWKEEREYIDEYGDEQYSGGHPVTSRRFRELTLDGPYSMDQLRIVVKSRRAFRASIYNWPAGGVARFVVPEEPPQPPVPTYEATAVAA